MKYKNLTAVLSCVLPTITGAKPITLAVVINSREAQPASIPTSRELALGHRTFQGSEREHPRSLTLATDKPTNSGEGCTFFSLQG